MSKVVQLGGDRTMNDHVKKFIEDNIYLIDANNFDELFNIAEKELGSTLTSQLINTFNQAGCDMKKYAIKFFQKLINIARGEALKENTPREYFRETVQMKLYLITAYMDDIGLSDEEKQQIFDRMV